MEPELAENIEPEIRCTCNDPYVTEVCPVHTRILHEPAENRPAVVTDMELVEGDTRQWAGFCFNCPRCGTPAIMSFMKHCGECGSKIIIQSDKVTSFVRQLQEKYNAGEK